MVKENRIDFHLNYLFNFWNRVPEISAEFSSYDEAEQEDFLIDTYPLACDALGSLGELRDTFSSEEETRYQELLALIAKNRHHIDYIETLISD